MAGLVRDPGAWHCGVRVPKGGGLTVMLTVRLLGSTQHCLLVCSVGGMRKCMHMTAFIKQ